MSRRREQRSEIAPTCPVLAEPVAVNCLADTRVVVSAVVPNKMVAPDAKLAPLTVIAKDPTGIDIGVIEEICGMGLFSVTMLGSDFVE